MTNEKKTFQINFYYISSTSVQLDKDIRRFSFFSASCYYPEITCTESGSRFRSMTRSWALSTTMNRIVRDWNINESSVKSVSPGKKRSSAFMWVKLEKRKQKLFPNLYFAVFSDKNQQWIRNQIYFLFIVPVVIFVVRNSTVPLNKGHSGTHGGRQVERKKHVVCYCWAKYCLLVDVKHFHIFSTHIILFSKNWTNVKFAAATDSYSGKDMVDE